MGDGATQRVVIGALWLRLATVSLKGRFAFKMLAAESEFMRIPRWQIDICSLLLPVRVNELELLNSYNVPWLGADAPDSFPSGFD